MKRANAICKETVPGLRAPDRKATSTTALQSATLDKTADSIAGVAARLRTLPVQSDDAARVHGWLADWDRLTVLFDYPPALRRAISTTGRRWPGRPDCVRRS